MQKLSISKIETLPNGTNISINSEVEFVATFAPRQMLRTYRNVTSLELAVKHKTASLAFYKKQFGEDSMIDYVKIWLMELNENLNLKQKMTEYQIEFCAVQILQDFFNLTCTDLHVIICKIMKGEFGEFYQSIDTSKLYQWVKMYFAERMNYCEQLFLKNDEKYKSTQPISKRLNNRIILTNIK